MIEPAATSPAVEGSPEAASSSASAAGVAGAADERLPQFGTGEREERGLGISPSQEAIRRRLETQVGDPESRLNTGLGSRFGRSELTVQDASAPRIVMDFVIESAASPSVEGSPEAASSGSILDFVIEPAAASPAVEGSPEAASSSASAVGVAGAADERLPQFGTDERERRGVGN